MPSNSYDLVVLGDDLAALVCGTLCARRGLRTLVLGEDRPARYQLGPHRMPIEPVLWPAQATAGDRVLRELHAELALRRKLREPRAPNPGAQVVLPDIRIDLGAGRLAGELAREVGKEAGEAWLARWDRSADVAKLAERAAADASAWWDDAKADPRAQLWRHLAAIALRHPGAAPAAIARVIDGWRTGPAALRGDGDGIRELLVEKLITAGGEVRAGKVTELGVSWGKIASLTLSNGDEIGTGQVVASKHPSELAQLLGKKAPKRLAELADGIALVGYRYTLNIVLDEAGVPEHMAPTVAVIAAPEKEPVGDAAFSLHLGEADDTGRVIATIAAILPADGALEPDRLVPKCMALRTALWQRLGDVMPFFERHLVLAHSPFEATPPQVPGGRGSYDVPRNLPLAMMPVWSAKRPAETAVEQIAGSSLTYTTGMKNLTLTGEQLLPTLGIEGAFASGWSAAKVACAIAGKKKDYLRDEVVGAA